MKAVETSSASPRGWGIDWASGATVARLVGVGALFSAISIVIASGMGLAVERTLAIESSFLGIALQLVLCAIVTMPLSALFRRWFPGVDDSTRSKIVILASRADRQIATGWVTVTIVAAGGIAWLIAEWLEFDPVGNAFAAIMCVQLVPIHLPHPYELILALCGSDPRSLPEPTTAETDAAQRTADQGLIRTSASIVYGLLACIVLALGLAFLRS